MNDFAAMPRRRFHQRVFLRAAIYNVVWGIWAGIDPQWLFRFSGMSEMTHPVVYSCLGMVIGLYGVIYAEVARAPERGFVLAAVGLTGKICGPTGWIYMYITGAWPLKSVVTIITNDLIWWIPFGIYLVDAWPFFKRDLKSSCASSGQRSPRDS